MASEERVCKDLTAILDAIELLADQSVDALGCYPQSDVRITNSPGLSLAIDAIAKLCDLGDRIYKDRLQDEDGEEEDEVS